MNNPDFGFGGEEFTGELSTVPYCQFFNKDNNNFGIAITSTNAELAQLELIGTWKTVEHEFTDGTQNILFVTKQPKLLILNRSKVMMSNDIETIPYSRAKASEGYKPFSYVVVWFLNDQNQPISGFPLRLKCSGYSGTTFLRHYSYYNNPVSFCKEFLAVYKSLTNDRAVEKNDIFYAHAIYQPQLVRRKVTSNANGQSSLAVVTEDFIAPTQDNFASMIIKNGSSTSDRIKKFIASTQSWLKTDAVDTLSDDPTTEDEF